MTTPCETAQRLLDDGRFDEALPILLDLDRGKLPEQANVRFVPDIVRVAEAAGAAEVATRYRALARDLLAVADGQARCVEHASGWRIETARPLDDADALAARVCNAFEPSPPDWPEPFLAKLRAVAGQGRQ